MLSPRSPRGAEQLMNVDGTKIGLSRQAGIYVPSLQGCQCFLEKIRQDRSASGLGTVPLPPSARWYRAQAWRAKLPLDDQPG